MIFVEYTIAPNTIDGKPGNKIYFVATDWVKVFRLVYKPGPTNRLRVEKRRFITEDEMREIAKKQGLRTFENAVERIRGGESECECII